jgi:hypothetical protein
LFIRRQISRGLWLLAWLDLRRRNASHSNSLNSRLGGFLCRIVLRNGQPTRLWPRHLVGWKISHAKRHGRVLPLRGWCCFGRTRTACNDRTSRATPDE